MTVSSGDDAPGKARRHVLRDLGWHVRRAGESLEGSAVVVPEMWAPGTDQLRLSILATWADTIAGLLAIDLIGPRVPVTLELDVQAYQPLPGSGTINGTSTLVKAGRSVLVLSVDFFSDGGQPIAFAAASFMAAPDSAVRFDTRTSVDQMAPEGTRLRVPFAERVGCVRKEPGVAVLPHSDEVLNASNTVNGGLIALTAEEAALSLTPGVGLASLGLRYLQPVRVGPVVAAAHVRHGVGRVEVRDEGNDNRLCVMATSRAFVAA